MDSAKVTTSVSFENDPVECYYAAFTTDKSFTYEFYKEFLLNKNTYSVGNFVIINGENSVDKILCIFKDRKKMVQLVVRKYIFAKTIRELLLKEVYANFDDSEVIEDLTKDYVVEADKILRKCYVIFGQESESSSEVVKTNNLDPLIYFFCRYTLKSDGLFPVLSTQQMICAENSLKSPPRKVLSLKKDKSKNRLTNLNTSGVASNETIRSKNVQKDIMSISEMSLCSPIQRNSVKRNLNESFDAYASDPNTSILNYSIISDEDIENPLLLKLKLSETNKKPVILLRKLNDVKSPVKKEKEIEVVSLRKSSRKCQRKSYADYISPIKSPRKRCNSGTTSENEESSVRSSNNSRNRRQKSEQEPDKKLEDSEESRKETVLGKRITKTPKRYQEGIDWDSPEKSGSKCSTRKSLRLTLSKNFNQDVTSNDRRVKKTGTKGTDEEAILERTPRKRANLDESFRRSILKINLNKLDDFSKSDRLRKGREKSKYIDGDSSSSDSEESLIQDRLISSSPSTPKRTRKRNDSFDMTFSPKTPKTNRKMTPRKASNTTPKSSTKQTPKTPRNRAKLIRDGVITPSMHARSKVITGDGTPLMQARSQLHVSYVPKALPCRDAEYRNILEFLESALLDGCGGCMYVSGVPGTGKTATVSSVISHLQQDSDIPNFNYVSINGMRLTEPRQSYVEILKQLTGKTVPWEQAQSILEEKFTKVKKMAPTVMLVDELDVLYTKRQDVVYNLLDWPTKAKNQLIVITIANTMDLPERLLMNRVASRLGLTRLTFQAYTHKQLQEIVKNRLSGTECFNPEAIEFVARKVASVSGDARRALDICRRAAEIAEAESSSQLVNMSHVNRAVNAMITQPKVRAIKNCSRLEQLILQSVVAEVERTGVEETSFLDVFKMLVSCAAIDGFKMVSSTNAFSAVARLSASRLILSDSKCNDITQKLILNVSVDDVYYALKKEQS